MQNDIRRPDASSHARQIKARTRARAQKAPAAPARGKNHTLTGSEVAAVSLSVQEIKVWKPLGGAGGLQDAKKQEEEAPHEDNSAVESNQHVCLDIQRRT